MEKEELLRQIETLLSFDGDAVTVNPDYLAYFSVEELEAIVRKLQRRQSEMVDRHREWMLGFRKDEPRTK